MHSQGLIRFNQMKGLFYAYASENLVCLGIHALLISYKAIRSGKNGLTCGGMCLELRAQSWPFCELLAGQQSAKFTVLLSSLAKRKQGKRVEISEDQLKEILRRVSIVSGVKRCSLKKLREHLTEKKYDRLFE